MKYIAYCRKSTDEKDRQILSIESQIQELTEFAKKQNLEIIEFISEAKTAKKPGREKFQKLLASIEKEKAQGIISWHPDRLARNSIDGGKIIYLLDTGKLIDLKFPSFWFENSPQGKFVLNIAFGQSKYYVDNLSENVIRGMKHLLRNGVWPAKSPWGYKYNHQAKRHEIVPLLSKIIKKAFRMFGKGSNQTDISKFLFKYGVTKKSDKPLGLNEVVRMLTNPFYVGKFKFKDEWYEGTHELFISKKLFDKVQKELEARKRTKFKRQKFAFAGLMKCGECGASITAEQHVKKSGLVFRYYRCTKKLKPCNQRYMPEPKLANQFRSKISDAAIPVAWAEDWLKWLEKDEMEERKKQDENIIALEEQIKKLDEKLNTLLDGYLDGIIEEETYKEKKNELFEKRLKLQEKKAEIEENGSSWLEPMREFTKKAADAAKIARAKNNFEDLAIFSKNIGSNFFLMDRRLVAEHKKPFELVKSFGGGAGAATRANADSLSERETGFGNPERLAKG